MRLLRTHDYTLESFFDIVPPYAILSHCWDEEEVVFSDLTDLEAARKKKGFAKIEKTCAKAAQDGFDYCWIDTCCIDKSSSAELSEAINSMFAWYKHSSKCYAYLADVDSLYDFATSNWFTRAWTLQELLAPTHDLTDDHVGMEFFTRDWDTIGSRSGLSSRISKITGIPEEYLEGVDLAKASISMRMSWAADRQATRAEDIAYALLGIFDVNMPLLYGEGKFKAFRRLQENIMKISEDETLFAWESIGSTLSTDVLASDPNEFSEAKSLVPFASDDPVIPYDMTHRGLRIWLQLYNLHTSSQHPSSPRHWIRPVNSPGTIRLDQNLVWAALRCHVSHDYHHHVMIPLRHLAADIYLRDTSTKVALVPTTLPLVSGDGMREIYIRNSRISSISNSIQRKHGFFIRTMPDGINIRAVQPQQAWDSKSKVLQGKGSSIDCVSWHASLRLTINRYEMNQDTSGHVFLSLGCRQDGLKAEPKPWCFLDDTIHEPESGEGNLAQFHASAIAKDEQRQVIGRLQTSSGDQISFQLRVALSTERLFGQHMFVVDIDIDQEESGAHIAKIGRSLTVLTANESVLESMFWELKDALLQGALRAQRFLPLDALDAIITAERLDAALPAVSSFTSSKSTKNIARHARKVFAILLLIGEPLSIRDLLKQGLRDQDLPLSAGVESKMRGSLTATDGRMFKAWKTAAKASEFLEKQWLVQAPVFGTAGQHFKLDNKCAMPFIDADEIATGSFGRVFKCELHQAHQKGHKIENGKTYVAVKQFKLKTNRGYLERWNLNVRKLRDLNHPHLIRHRVTCEFDDAYYAVFPLADGGDLLQYWKLSKRTLSTPELALWMLRQMLGLIDALAALHDRKLRHSNLNPANILVFNSATDPILVIGDVGGYLQDSSQISLQNSFRATMPSYEAPEAYVNSQSSLSRKVDLWSLGCIFLEFTIWCLWDYDAVTAVRDRRVAPDMHSYFFSNDRVNVHPEAISSMSSLLRDSRVGPDTALSRLVVLIQDDLLQVDENRRPKADKVVAKLKSVVKKIVANELLACKNDANPSSKPEILLTQDKQLMDYSSKASLS